MEEMFRIFIGNHELRWKRLGYGFNSHSTVYMQRESTRGEGRRKEGEATVCGKSGRLFSCRLVVEMLVGGVGCWREKKEKQLTWLELLLPVLEKEENEMVAIIGLLELLSLLLVIGGRRCKGCC